MSKLDAILEEIVTANRILAREGVVDSFGHISARHPDNPQHFLLSRARAPDCIEKDDIMEFTLEGEPVNAARARALSRALHPRRRSTRRGPDVHSVVHNHSPSVIPFGVTSKKLQAAAAHVRAHRRTRCRSGIRTTSSATPRCWSTAWRWAATWRRRMGGGRTILMRGHGATVAANNVRYAVFTRSIWR